MIQNNKIVFCHLDDPNNIGDQLCCPIDYINLKGARYDLSKPIPDIKFDALIFGGGGIFHAKWLNNKINEIASLAKRKNKNAKLIVWGAGLNYHGVTHFDYPEFLKNFNLVGLRDKDNPWKYVPCSSALNPLFSDSKTYIEHEFSIYEHFNFPFTKLFPKEIPSMNNNKDRRLFSDVISFLSKSETIITNSYHGIYWSLLLGRKVLLFKPFSNRFLGFNRDIINCDENNWKEKSKKTAFHSDYLGECREYNLKFLDDVKKLLNYQ